MAIIDLDEFLEKKEKAGFRLAGKEYVLPELSYDLTLKLEVLRRQTAKALKEEKLEEVMENSVEVITTVVPELDAGFLKSSKVALSQLRKITDLINKKLLAEEPEEKNAELEYYRKTYGDEFRKKGQEPGKSSSE